MTIKKPDDLEGMVQEIRDRHEFDDNMAKEDINLLADALLELNEHFKTEMQNRMAGEAYAESLFAVETTLERHKF